ncbi:fimbrial biogenesis chaperone [Lelliottia wanjuensis]|uniref:fimbrial biogenesis chaperone n=1 Tax=Lelliottia wanjuensis TaxID=3050585 RepID=UPI00254F71E8|nr:molecular chaperone [Lelliottia sp. V104_15]MDK9607537.1 molecular chaperone [Lelliottia sp. V104_15]
MNLVSLIVRRMLLGVALLVALVQDATAENGGISISRTRVIFQSTDNAQTVSLQNHGNLPYLVQSAVVASPNGHEPAPFLTTPPLFRLEGHSKNAVRILRKGDAALPDDRESVFYFTAIAVPSMSQPKESDDTALAARVSVGIQNTIKLFYRPVGLAIAQEEAAGRLGFQHKGATVQVSNPTPYYLTFSRLAFDEAEVDISRGIMIAPFSHISVPAAGNVRRAQWTLINDYGGNSPLFKAAVKSGGAT